MQKHMQFFFSFFLFFPLDFSCIFFLLGKKKTQPIVTITGAPALPSANVLLEEQFLNEKLRVLF